MCKRFEASAADIVDAEAHRSGPGVTLYALKPRFQAALRPLAARLAKAGVTANQVTIATALGSIGVGTLLALAAALPALFLVLPVWLFVRMALNAMDGMMAREFGQETRLGAYLNEIGDVIADIALYWPFAFVQPFGPFAVGLVVFLAALAEFIGAMGPSIGASRRYDGPLGKSDRALVFGALGTWIGISGQLPGWTVWLMPALVLLLILTAVNRIRAGLTEAGSNPEEGA